MRVFFNIPQFAKAYGKPTGQGETLEQYLDRIGPNGRQSIVRSLQEEYLQKLPELNLQDPQIKTETALVDRLVFPIIQNGQFPSESELQDLISDLENPEAHDLSSLENLLIQLVQHAYKRGVHFV